MTAISEIRSWLERGKEQGATHMIVVCDTFDYSDFPVFVKPGDDPRKVAEPYKKGQDMTRLMEVYSLSASFEEQLNQTRCYNYD